VLRGAKLPLPRTGTDARPYEPHDLRLRDLCSLHRPEAAAALMRNPTHIYEVAILVWNFTLLISGIYMPEPVAKCPPLLGLGARHSPVPDVVLPILFYGAGAG